MLAIANGTTLVSATIGGEPAAAKALRLIDGSDESITVTTDTGGPAEFVYELAGPTTFEQFRIPGIEESPGNATFYRDIEIAGSAESATAGFEMMVTAELEPLGPDDTAAEITPTDVGPVRWIRVGLENG